VIDDKPRQAAEFDAEALAELAAMVEAEVASLSLAIGDEPAIAPWSRPRRCWSRACAAPT
jgi:hypothetical protein